jgi:hypothetical protein
MEPPPTLRRLICFSDILRRPGWTRAKIAKLLWPPVARYRNTHHGAWSPMRMFSWSDMIQAEQTDEFRKEESKHGPQPRPRSRLHVGRSPVA